MNVPTCLLKQLHVEYLHGSHGRLNVQMISSRTTTMLLYPSVAETSRENVLPTTVAFSILAISSVNSDPFTSQTIMFVVVLHNGVGY